MAINFSMNTTCETAEYLAHNVQLHVMLIFRVFIAFSGLVLILAIFRVQGTYLMFHSNARVLMFSHHVWIMLQCLSNILLHLTNLIRYAAEDNNDLCQYVITTEFSVFIRSPSIFSLYGQVWALASLAVERLFATIWFRDYEKSGRRLGISLVVIQVLIYRLL
jgi:hypothetical protein